MLIASVGVKKKECVSDIKKSIHRTTFWSESPPVWAKTKTEKLSTTKTIKSINGQNYFVIY